MKRGSSGDGGERSGSPTLQDVARAAGVSIATASFVANGRQDVRLTDATRERVQKVIADLGYRANAIAKTLADGGSRFIGLVADAIATTPFAGQIIHGAQDEAWRQGYVLLVANTEGDEGVEAEAIGMMLAHQVRGILYSTWFHREVDVPTSLSVANTVLVNCYSRSSSYAAVVPDEVQGGLTATQMLLDAGHRRIAFINTTSEAPARWGRLAGYQEALAQAGVDSDPALILDAQPDQEGGYAAVDAILAAGATAVFCHNDRVAMGLYAALGDRGLRVPADIAVVGFDNQEVISAHLRPPLSTVQLPHYELGVAGVRALLEREAIVSTEIVTVACPPVVRGSVAPPRVTAIA
jgi:LacI family transcriptional regulator